MPENPLGGMLDAVREVYHAPGETPKEAMWDVIQRGVEAASGDDVIDLTAVRNARPVRTYLAWAAAAAAVLVMGVGIGRMTSPVGSDLPVANASDGEETSLRFAAAEHFGRTESLLTMVRADARQGRIDPMTSTWARGLLVQTRLLIDNGSGAEPAMEELLEDLELVLAQIVGLAESGLVEGDRTRMELELAVRGVEERELLPRLQAAGRPLGLSGT